MKITNHLPEVKVSFTSNRNSDPQIILTSSAKVFQLCLQIWDLNTIDLYEEMKVIYLDRKNAVIGYRDLSRGSTTGTLVDIKLVFTIGILCNACSLILCHNHPSGQVYPSEQDKKLTQKASEAGLLLDLKVLDHLIISRERYYSFCDEGFMIESTC